jgi:hypothetical protein
LAIRAGAFRGCIDSLSPAIGPVNVFDRKLSYCVLENRLVFSVHSAEIEHNKDTKIEMIPPSADLSAIEVNLTFSLLQVIDFNEVAGTIEIVGFLHLEWQDELIDDSFDEVDHGSLIKFLIPEDNIWKPPISIFNSVKAIRPISDSTYKARVQMDYSTCVTNDSSTGTIKMSKTLL